MSERHVGVLRDALHRFQGRLERGQEYPRELDDGQLYISSVANSLRQEIIDIGLVDRPGDNIGVLGVR